MAGGNHQGMEEEYDLVIIGAGPSGIVLARFYLSIHPTHRLAILEQEEVIGGVWSSARQYPGFRSESGLRMSGFSDRPIILPPEAHTYDDTFEAKYVTQYLEDYVDVHVHDGKSLRERVIFGLRLRESRRWLGNVATGQNSLPHTPSFLNQANFKSPIVHQKHFGQIAMSALAPDSPTHQSQFLGGGKSATDMVYECTKASKKVTWIIRRSGEGPAIFAEMSATRAFAALSPSCFTPQTWVSRFIHQSSIVNSIVSKIWKGADEDAAKLADFEREDALPGEVYWCNGPIGLIHHDDFWDTVAKNVKVYRDDIQRLESRAIILEDGTVIDTDMLLCGTGWTRGYPFLTPQQTREFGLSHPAEDDASSESKI
ncbi:6da0d101-4a71-4fb8-bdfd-d3c7751095aa [Sclerotinia trifoliorum]|uniref:6da0d101-4a71-4fb8-bdfd-d3c7751095aa n=1 Tax=Sclerotinia trifoliorum TaxID=28548 RepID=A0A8H2ZN26_9HELO|nr:6da0d101-4a71-4fb8-bdfd-d3c7751095aa [Sclerotinia trifoliorum]